MNNPDVVETLERESANRFCGPWRVGESWAGNYEVRTEVPDGRTAAVLFTVDNAAYAEKPERTIRFTLLEVEMALEDLIETYPKQS